MCISDKDLLTYKISTLDVPKRPIDYGSYPPTIYFPLVIAGAIMIESMETESIEDINIFINTMKQIVKEAKETPELLKEAPVRTKAKRLDKTMAAQNSCLTG